MGYKCNKLKLWEKQIGSLQEQASYKLENCCAGVGRGGTKYLSITKEFTPIDDIKDVKKVEDGHTTIQDARVI